MGNKEESLQIEKETVVAETNTSPMYVEFLKKKNELINLFSFSKAK